MTSTAIVEEVTVLVQLCSSVLPSVPKSELVRTVPYVKRLSTEHRPVIYSLGSW
jgi:hypothetical protein